MNDEILINRMFRGEYLDGHIGHEIINLFKADDGNNYLYVNPYGSFNKKHRKRITTILLVRNYGKGVFEILAKATDLEAYIDDSLPRIKEENKETRSKIRNNQETKCRDIRYDGISILDIFEENDDENQAILVTFKAKKYFKVKTGIHLLLSEVERAQINGEHVISLANSSREKHVHLPKQSLKAYYAQGDEKTGYVYDRLMEAINNPDLWETTNSTTRVDKELQPQEEHYNFLKLIHKEDDELCFSNMLAHFLSNEFGLYQDFAKEVLELKVFGSACEIWREEGNIDLLLDDGVNRIVIENKIKSHVNGIQAREKDDNRMIQSQLSKYRKAQEKKLEEEGLPRKLSCFLLHPEYQQIDLSTYADGSKYAQISYKRLYEFFTSHKLYAPYYDDFCNALFKHAQEVSEDLYQENLIKFLTAIQKRK